MACTRNVTDRWTDRLEQNRLLDPFLYGGYQMLLFKITGISGLTRFHMLRTCICAYKINWHHESYNMNIMFEKKWIIIDFVGSI